MVQMGEVCFRARPVTLAGWSECGRRYAWSSCTACAARSHRRTRAGARRDCGARVAGWSSRAASAGCTGMTSIVVVDKADWSASYSKARRDVRHRLFDAVRLRTGDRRTGSDSFEETITAIDPRARRSRPTPRA